MELLAAIRSRSSAPRLTAPGPSPEELACILEAAERAPDHGRLKPWHLVVLEADQKRRFAAAAAEAKAARSGAMSEAQLAAERDKILRSPSIVVAGCALRESTKIPEIEQIVAVAAAVQNMFLAAHDLGYGVMWKTGAAAYDSGVKAVVGLQPRDHIVAIMHLGTRA